jgi:hypothetical protein
MEFLWYFLAGFAAFNAIPHLVKGITGQTHMTPFARISSPVLNVGWAFANILFALFFFGLASGYGTLVTPWSANLTGGNLVVTLLGGFVCAMYLANFWSNPKAKLPWQK